MADPVLRERVANDSVLKRLMQRLPHGMTGDTTDVHADHPADNAGAETADARRTMELVTLLLSDPPSGLLPAPLGPAHASAQWATSTPAAQGDFRGRSVNSAGAELMVLTRVTDGWRINAIHWSSRSRRS